MEVTIVVPVLRRPHRVGPLVQSVVEATVLPFRILFMVTARDDAELAAVRQAEADYGLLVDHYTCPAGWEGHGDYARKVNAGYRATTSPLIFTGADDLLFHPGWLEAARAHLAPGIGVVGTNDQCNRRVMRGEHSTHSLVTRAYADDHGVIDQPGAIFHEGYPHECCDDELVQTAMARRAWAFARTSIVEHLHPTAGKARWDQTYTGPSGRQARMDAGRALLAERRPLWSI